MSGIIRQRVPQEVVKWSLQFAAVGVVVGLAMAGMYFAIASQSARRVKLAEVVGNNAPGSVLIDRTTGGVNSEVVAGQAIATQANTEVSIQQNNQAIARLGEKASLTVENDCLQLGQGQAVFSSIQGCLGAVIVSSSDGAYTLERVGTLGEIKVLSGQVTVAIPSNPSVTAIALQPNQKITISLAGDDVGPVRLMLPSEVDEVLNGRLFQAFRLPLANQTQIAGLAPSSQPSPSPTQSPKPLPAPAQKAVAGSATNKPSLPVAPASVQSSNEAPDSGDEETGDEDAKTRASYSRPVWRKRVVVRDRYTPRRRWRIPYTEASTYRRSSPSSEPSDMPTSPSPNPIPAAEHPHPSSELPPVMPPMEPLPPPTVVEPPLAPLPPGEGDSEPRLLIP